MSLNGGCVRTIAVREFLTTVRRKGFLLTLFLMPLYGMFATAMGALPTLLAKRSTEDPGLAKFHGLARTLVANAVTGVTEGYKRELDIVGTGYRADVKGKIATFVLGYSHPIELLLPDGVDLKIDKQTHLVLSGHDKQMVGQVAANIRALRKPDPYKNKGVRYTGEVLRKKAGKTGAGAKAK